MTIMQNECATLYRTFKQMRRDNARIGHDHSRLDETESRLFELALAEEKGHVEGSNVFQNALDLLAVIIR